MKGNMMPPTATPKQPYAPTPAPVQLDPAWGVTPAGDFKRTRQGIPVTLQSTGRVVVLRGVQLVRALARQEIPDSLTPIAAALIWGARESSDKQLTVADLALEYSALMDWVVAESMLYPRITADGAGEDEIQITDLDPDEIQEIYDLATHPARMLRPFRGEQD